MSSDPNDRSSAPEAGAEPPEVSDSPDLAAQGAASAEPEQAAGSDAQGEPGPEPAPSEQASAGPADADAETTPPPRRRQRVLIGSQRDPARYRPKPQRDSIRIVGLPRPAPRKKDEDRPETEQEAPTEEQPTPPAEATAETKVDDSRALEQEPARDSETAVQSEETVEQEIAAAEGEEEGVPPGVPTSRKKHRPPNIRDRLPPDLEHEFQEALADVSLEELIDGDEALARQAVLEPDSQHLGRVVVIHHEDVFVELGGREQGILSVKQFAEPPEIGAELNVRVVRFNPEEGLYELTVPGAAADIGDWSDLEEGMMVEARVTGHNSGGLECEVNHLRGFIPVSQIALYRVENLAELVDEKLTCLVTECNPQRRNLVLSRRAVLEREREEARQNLLDSLEPGQTREGVVRKLVDFGAFVDLGGVDGLVHVSQLGWGRVNHPREVVQEGQTIRVKIQSVDTAAGRISLAYRDMLENPWENVATKYPENTSVRGKVTRLMDFGAFVELEPGVEGLVHISELSHKRVWRVSDVVNEGDEVDVLVLSVDAEAQRIGLSMKGLIPEPKPAEKERPSEPEEPAPPSKPRAKPSQPLKGGLGRSPGGAKFGLKW